MGSDSAEGDSAGNRLGVGSVPIVNIAYKTGIGGFFDTNRNDGTPGAYREVTGTTSRGAEA
jgi:hypothetical protein